MALTLAPTDLAEHMGILHTTFYHVGAFGVLGIEDSLAYPEFLVGTNFAQQSLPTRIFLNALPLPCP